MLTKTLKELMTKTMLTLDDINTINNEMINQEVILAIFEDSDFINELISSNVLAPIHGHQPLFFSIMFLTFYNDLALFPVLMGNPRFKNIFIDHCKKYREEHFEVPFFNIILFKKSELAFLNLKTIMEDEQLRTCFCESRHAGRTLILFSEKNPEYIQYVLSSNELRKAIKSDRHNHNAMFDILHVSEDKENADIVFSANDSGVACTDELKEEIYNKIAQNYREKLPNSLYKLCLFAVTENKIAINPQATPGDIQKSIRNFSIK